MENFKAVRYLEALIGKTLRIHTTDTRIFVGTFKCTDNDRNVILATTHEYRYPTPSAVSKVSNASANQQQTGDGVVKVDMTNRFIGLVVVPGQHITKVELEKFPNRAPCNVTG
ncbi:hypothetical protein AJ80_00364 [Polytolypa hystricis UAMH7299]|uniref:Sm domain-containing protein n=1 Tax=Polytolypa hystricis (strain UAMH7299) TaxID=1447883 RepID=A0A2B7Z2F7_POLH7|nr:hypothetical protein AJ80_00364 [Polytolypa hystricis UAMH7299]